MVARRIEIGPLVALLAALLLLISLFLEWFDPGVTAWEVFEALDLVLAGAALTAIVVALGLAGAPIASPEPRWLGWAAGLALVLVLATLLDEPPAVRGADPDTGLWLALAGSVLMALGALLSIARVRLSLDVESRRRRMEAVDARRREDETTAAMLPDSAPPESRL